MAPGKAGCAGREGYQGSIAKAALLGDKHWVAAEWGQWREDMNMAPFLTQLKPVSDQLSTYSTHLPIYSQTKNIFTSYIEQAAKTPPLCIANTYFFLLDSFRYS